MPQTLVLIFAQPGRPNATFALPELTFPPDDIDAIRRIAELVWDAIPDRRGDLCHIRHILIRESASPNCLSSVPRDIERALKCHWLSLCLVHDHAPVLPIFR